MTDHPITPPPELVRQWQEESLDDPTGAYSQAIANRAAQWGADQMSNRIPTNGVDYTKIWYDNHILDRLIAVEKAVGLFPPNPSLKEQALIALDDADLDAAHENILRRALEALPDD